MGTDFILKNYFCYENKYKSVLLSAVNWMLKIQFWKKCSTVAWKHDELKGKESQFIQTFY